MKTVKFDRTDRDAFNYCYNTMDQLHEQVILPLPITMTENEARKRYEEIFAKYVDVKVKEHNLRVAAANKYDLPYFFAFDGVEGTGTCEDRDL